MVNTISDKYSMMDIQQAINSYNTTSGVEFHPKAVLFDMDGVLYDSMPHHAIAWQKSMAQFGINMTAHDAYATEGARGFDTVKMLVKQQKGIDISDEKAKEMYGVKSNIFHAMHEAPIFEGVKELMQRITDAGLSVNVVTGSAQKPLIARLHHDFGQWLAPDHITTAYDVTRGKPDPDPYLTGLRKAGNLETVGRHRRRECALRNPCRSSSRMFHHRHQQRTTPRQRPARGEAQPPLSEDHGAARRLE